MTFVFMFVLLLNCLVIFAADALLGNELPPLGGSTSPRTPILPAQFSTASDIDNAMIKYTLSPPVGDGKGKVVARKGVELLVNDTISGTNAPASSLAVTLEKANMTAETTAKTYQSTTEVPAHKNVSASTVHNVRSDSSLPEKSVSVPVKNQTLGIASTSSTLSTLSTKANTIKNTTVNAPPPSTTPKPHKPKITYSVANDPNRVISLEGSYAQQTVTGSHGTRIEPADAPQLQPSREFVVDAESNTGHKYIIPVVTLIFAIPMVLAIGIVLTRRFKSYWATRHYRRMDFLVDGMYNT